MSHTPVNRRSFLGFAASGATASLVGSGVSLGGEANEPQSLPFNRDLPVQRKYDLVICGGGPSGIAAALAARRSGLSVLVVEGQGQLGGTGISSLVLFAVMRKHIPGFAEARLKAVASALGVRETRRIVGSYVLTVDDVRQGKEFDDIIGYSAYGWDLPDPKLPSYNPSHGKRPEVAAIPYRIMVPSPIENLICPGRAVSVERFVLGPLRVMAPCMAMGEAAGEAALSVVRDHVPFGKVDAAQLRERLRANGAIVDWA